MPEGLKIDNDKITLATVLNGAAEERFELSLRKVLENIRDPNTNWKVKRQVQVVLTLEPLDEHRDAISASLVVGTKLAPLAPYTGRLMAGKDGFYSKDPRQMSLGDEPQDTETRLQVSNGGEA